MWRLMCFLSLFLWTDRAVFAQSVPSRVFRGAAVVCPAGCPAGGSASAIPRAWLSPAGWQALKGPVSVKGGVPVVSHSMNQATEPSSGQGLAAGPFQLGSVWPTGMGLLALAALGAFFLCRFWRRRLQQVQAQNRRLAELDGMKSRCFANIAHEFRTPLTLILGQLERAIEQGGGGGQDDGLRVARRNARRLLRLVNQVLELGSLEVGAAQLNKTRLDLVGFLRSLVGAFEPLAEQKGIQLCFQTDRTSLPVQFDSHRLEDAFRNLLSNAFKYTPAGGRITLSLEQGAGRAIRIRVQDSGEGIPADKLAHIFDRFYRAEELPRADREGTGIGLALAREQVHLHGGTLSAASTVGKGSVFTVVFPLEALQPVPLVQAVQVPAERAAAPGGGRGLPPMEKPPPAIPALPGSGNQPSSRAPRILIVEDDADTGQFLVQHLQSGYRLLQARDGTEGLAIARKKIPDLVLTDLKMPGMDGHALCTALKSDPLTSHIPVVFLSARADRDNRLQAFQCGADEYLTKPFHSKELLVRIGGLIALRQSLRRRFQNQLLVRPEQVSADPLDQQFMRQVLAAIHIHLDNEQFNVPLLAREVAMSVSQLNRKLRALIGQSAGRLIRSVRLQRAAELLTQQAGTVAEVCYQVGFPDQANFTRAFKKQFGEPPGSFRTAHQNPDA
ncbi:MAG: response regulator [Calditrichaeota bacterium]|nr:MAG: response regulator [Calditrichota bacterium]